MEDNIILRIANTNDAKRLIEIYNPYVMNTCVSYEHEAVSESEFAERIEHYSEQYPYIIAEQNGRILGYAYASPFHARYSFRWDTEVSVYLDKDERHKGIGSILMKKILDILQKCNYVNVYSYINFPNDASIKLHEKFGFKECSRYTATGFKHGNWRTLVGLEKRIANFDSPKELDYNWQKYV